MYFLPLSFFEPSPYLRLVSPCPISSHLPHHNWINKEKKNITKQNLLPFLPSGLSPNYLSSFWHCLSLFTHGFHPFLHGFNLSPPPLSVPPLPNPPLSPPLRRLPRPPPSVRLPEGPHPLHRQVLFHIRVRRIRHPHAPLLLRSVQ